MATSRLGKQISQILEKKTIKRITTIISRVTRLSYRSIDLRSACGKVGGFTKFCQFLHEQQLDQRAVCTHLDTRCKAAVFNPCYFLLLLLLLLLHHINPELAPEKRTAAFCLNIKKISDATIKNSFSPQSKLPAAAALQTH